MNELQMCRNIHDGLHGLIRLTREEMAVIDHPLFQRLRSICQTGLLKLVCPTATHTRFEHSLGTLHMAQRMLDALHRESHIITGKLYAPADALPGQAVRFNDFSHATHASMQRVLRLCALVHDLGHGPLSHTFETFMPAFKDIAPLLDDARLLALAPVKEALLKGKHGRIEHEAMSCLLFAVIWQDLDGEPWVPRAVAAVLLGSDPGPVDPQLRPLLPLVRDMVSSAPIDADRMDYLLRDSKATGVCYGLYEPNRVLKSILCMRGPDGESYRLGWRWSGLKAIQSFVMARYQMFDQIYYNKTWRAICLMLQDVSRHADKLETPLIGTDSLDALLADYENMSDEAFLRTLRGDRRSDRIVHPGISNLMRQVHRRRLWRSVYEFHGDEGDPKAFVNDLQAKHPDRSFILDLQKVKAMKDLERGAPLLTFDRKRRYSLPRKKRSWLEASPIMRTLAQTEQSLVRLYLRSESPEDAKEVKISASHLAAERREQE